MPTFCTNGQLFTLTGIQPTELHRQKAVLSLARRAQEPEYLLYKRLLSSLCGQLRQLKLRHLFVPSELQLLNDLTQPGTSVARWAEYTIRLWSMELRKNASRLHTFIKNTSPTPQEISFARPA